VHNVSQWPNLRHLGEPLGGAEGLLEAVSFKKTTESIGGGRVARFSQDSQCTAVVLRVTTDYAVFCH